jgi:hypothetical protein
VDPADAPFGATLREIDDSAKTIADDNTQINAVATELLGSCRTTLCQMDTLKVTDNQNV